MPGSRRPVSRVQSTPPPANTSKTKASDPVLAPSSENSEGSLLNQLPKHAHIPDIPLDHNFVFEGMAYGFALLCLGLQYINLYKTVWWLPHSHSNYALNFYLIDPYLVMFLSILMSRRMVWCFVKEVFGSRSSRSCFYWLVQLFKLTTVVCLVGAFGWTGYHVVLKHSLLYSLFLCYPLAIYMILFGFHMKPLFGKVHVQPSVSGEKNTPKHKSKEAAQRSSEFSVSHNCSMSPEAVREEADMLKTDFNDRIKQVLFNSMVCAYYTGFIPLCFAQHVGNDCDECWNTLYYDTWWVGQHVVLIWISGFALFMSHFLPAKYIDILHRCALHLGRWVKVEGRHAHVPYNAWSELQVWQQGALVKHVRGLFKAEGVHNSAEPGNGMHSRFYFMFFTPMRTTNWLLIILLGLIAYEFLLLIQAIEWSHILSLTFLLFVNYYTLFKVFRDKLVLSKAYKDEKPPSQSQ